jgi:hypothetical protein
MLNESIPFFLARYNSVLLSIAEKAQEHYDEQVCGFHDVKLGTI